MLLLSLPFEGLIVVHLKRSVVSLSFESPQRAVIPRRSGVVAALLRGQFLFVRDLVPEESLVVVLALARRPLLVPLREAGHNAPRLLLSVSKGGPV